MKDKIKTLFTLSASDNINKISSRDYYIIKWIAIITMIIDHIGAFCKISASNTIFFRTVGRIAFPLFCFMLVECFFFTKNKIKHLIKLLIIAIISEIPFNMTHVITFCSKLTSNARNIDIINTLSDASAQNVCFTLILGFIMIALLEVDFKKILRKLLTSDDILNFSNIFIKCLIVFLTGFFAATFMTDYDYKGIILIFFFYIAKKMKCTKTWQFLGIMIFIIIQSSGLKYLYQFSCILDLAVIYSCYKSENFFDSIPSSVYKILSCKPARIFASIFYPLHLLIIALVRLYITG